MHKIPSYFLLAIASCASLAAQAAPVDGVAAVISYESERLTAEGVWRSEKYQDRFFRLGDHVWVERVVPENAPKATRAGAEHAHDKLDLAVAARHITKAKSGQANIAFVSSGSNMIIEVRRDDMNAVGFNGEWDSAYHIIKPSVIKAMRESRDPSTETGAKWYEQTSANTNSRILWSAEMELPLRIETRDLKGTFRNRISVKVSPFSGASRAPWSRVGNYVKKEYSDLLD